VICWIDAITPDVESGALLHGVGELIVDCGSHGEIGQIPAGEDERGRAEELLATHIEESE
jgi:hypothetical protein